MRLVYQRQVHDGNKVTDSIFIETLNAATGPYFGTDDALRENIANYYFKEVARQAQEILDVF